MAVHYLKPGDPLYEIAQCRLNVSCGGLVEMAYYASKFGHDICCYCADPGEKCEESLKKFKTVLPICPPCKEKGSKIITARPYGPRK